jgi:hypothetical protein
LSPPSTTKTPIVIPSFASVSPIRCWSSGVRFIIPLFRAVNPTSAELQLVDGSLPAELEHAECGISA